MSEYYDPDQDAQPQSPLLQVVKPRATPSPSPPPLVTPQPLGPPATRYPRYCSPRRHRKASRRRRRNQPSQGDYVLIRAMDPSRLDIARRAGEEALPYNPESDSNSPTDTGSETDDDDMEDQSSSSEVSRPSATAVQPEPSSGQTADLQVMAQRVLDTQNDVPRHPPAFPRDSVIDIDGDSHATSARRTFDAPPASHSRVETAPSRDGYRHSAPSLTVPNTIYGAFANGFPTRPRAPSPHLGQLSIPERPSSPSTKLPAIQPESPLPARSPDQEMKLPSLQAVLEQQEREGSSFSAHRPSIASSAHSPTSNPRQLSISSARSPGTTFTPLSAISPLSTNGEDIFLRTSSSALFGTQRRQSQVSETTSPYPATLHSASDRYHSPGGISPGTQPTPTDVLGPRLSIDSALAAQRTLPRPLALGAPPLHISSIPPHGHGEYKCDYPGCKAAPFQTQYLLNSHANVHSSSRPHYCPVLGCSRAEGGKGFKRKNEMIRHGLVHSSPGYICPFCPDREHRYPRPDNLQRHVRVHHDDKDKDDPKLREVLSQRPEGGTRGRRRRPNS